MIILIEQIVYSWFGSEMMKLLKKRWKLILALGVAAAVLGGVMGPFVPYKTVSKAAAADIHTEEFRGRTEGPDRAMLLESNTSAWEERIRLINRAKERIIISTFDMREGQSTRDILAMLLEKAKEGVKVEILVDGVSAFTHMKDDPLFQAVSAQPEIEIRLYNEVNVLQFWKLNGRMHDKYVIVDDMAYILGGRNMFDYFIGDYKTENRSYDREVLIYNPKGKKAGDSSLYQVENYFNKLWNSKLCTSYYNETKLLEKPEVVKEVQALEKRYEELAAGYPELFADCDYSEVTVPANKVTLISNPTGVYGKEPIVFYTLSRLMEEAKERVIIHTPYIVCNSYMYEELSKISSKVPKVDMMINSVENGDNFVASSDYRFHKGEVMDTGVNLYEYDGGLSYHGKSMVIDDDLSVVGSYNMDLRSTYVDTELMLVINSQAFTGQLTEAMEDLQKDCREATGADTYKVPKHLEIEAVPFWKKAAWTICGLFLQPFRRLI